MPKFFNFTNGKKSYVGQTDALSAIIYNKTTAEIIILNKGDSNNDIDNPKRSIYSPNYMKTFKQFEEFMSVHSDKFIMLDGEDHIHVLPKKSIKSISNMCEEITVSLMYSAGEYHCLIPGMDENTNEYYAAKAVQKIARALNEI